jgi:hypothetical protein
MIGKRQCGGDRQCIGIATVLQNFDFHDGIPRVTGHSQPSLKIKQRLGKPAHRKHKFYTINEPRTIPQKNPHVNLNLWLKLAILIQKTKQTPPRREVFQYYRILFHLFCYFIRKILCCFFYSFA